MQYAEAMVGKFLVGLPRLFAWFANFNWKNNLIHVEILQYLYGNYVVDRHGVNQTKATAFNSQFRSIKSPK